MWNSGCWMDESKRLASFPYYILALLDMCSTTPSNAITSTTEVIVVEHPLYHRDDWFGNFLRIWIYEYISDVWYAVLLIFIQPNLYLSNSVEHPFIYLNSSILPVQYNTIQYTTHSTTSKHTTILILGHRN